MDPEIKSRLREAGEELREDHGQDLIADTIGEIEASDQPTSEQTAEVLRIMADAE